MAKTGTCPDCGGAMYRYAQTCNGCKSKGVRNPRYGARLSDETKAKISVARTGKTYGPRITKPKEGHAFARRWFPLPDLCEDCLIAPPLDRHHIDGDSLNNAAENIAFLCRRCHQKRDGRHEFVKHKMPSMGGKYCALVRERTRQQSLFAEAT
jgi:hypothetical protein